MSLVERAIERLEREWGEPVEVGAIRMNHDERAVFEVRHKERNVIVKIDVSGLRFKGETAALMLAADAEIPVPAILYSVPAAPTILVLELVVGSQLAAGTDARAWIEAGHWLQALHALEPPGFLNELNAAGRTWREHFLWWVELECVRHAQLGQAMIGRIRSVLTEAFNAMDDPDLTLVHGDCQEQHFLIGPDLGVAGIIDFGDASRGDVVWDIAVLTIRSPERLHDLLAGYQPNSSTRERIRTLLPAYQLIRAIGSASWLDEHGFDGSAALRVAEHLLENWSV